MLHGLYPQCSPMAQYNMYTKVPTKIIKNGIDASSKNINKFFFVYLKNITFIIKKRLFSIKNINSHFNYVNELVKPIYDYLKNGERYSSGGYVNNSPKLIIPFLDYLRTEIPFSDLKNFGQACRNNEKLSQEEENNTNNS